MGRREDRAPRPGRNRTNRIGALDRVAESRVDAAAARRSPNSREYESCALFIHTHDVRSPRAHQSRSVSTAHLVRRVSVSFHTSGLAPTPRGVFRAPPVTMRRSRRRDGRRGRCPIGPRARAPSPLRTHPSRSPQVTRRRGWSWRPAAADERTRAPRRFGATFAVPFARGRRRRRARATPIPSPMNRSSRTPPSPPRTPRASRRASRTRAEANRRTE